MHDALGVGVVERLGDVAGDFEGLLERERGALADLLLEGVPFHHLHREERAPLVLAGGEDAHDPRVVELLAELPLAQEAGDERLVGQAPLVRHLERDGLPVAPSARAVGGRHAAPPEHALQVERADLGAGFDQDGGLLLLDGVAGRRGGRWGRSLAATPPA